MNFLSALNPANWLAIIGIAAVVFMAGFGTHWKISSGSQAKADVKHIQAEVKQHHQAEQTLEVKRNERKTSNAATNAAVNKIVTRVEYRTVCLDSIGVSIADQALSGSAKPNAALPKANAP